ncbi:acyltransferase [Catenuloplanes indicus]|uniref:Acetyltransferase-like isoleucine patch superfamily enzyme n=1 Tax=Catenuloplanes indicus TaxID=137267 RepID=A0AAE4B478_9ACTN|nr:acyltransferase [Catenuloplanes indicus]MDQ0371058.1 acetyltransferase-like isoleucine patch superfamily enzyme [Catenuloplanes indicus]
MAGDSAPVDTERAPAPVGVLVRQVFRLKRAWYRLRYPRLTLGRDVQIRGRIRLRRGVTVVIGDRCRLNKLVRFAGPGVVRIGPDTLLNGSWVGCWTTVTVGAGSLLSDCELVDNTFHNLDPARRHAAPSPSTRAPITVGENVWIGAGALVMKGVTIGRDSVVGAATVVRTDVPARVVVIGNPQQIAKRFDD